MLKWRYMHEVAPLSNKKKYFLKLDIALKGTLDMYLLLYKLILGLIVYMFDEQTDRQNRTIKRLSGLEKKELYIHNI